MANTLINTSLMTNELLRRFKNNLGFSGAIQHGYDEKFGRDGAKIGDTLKIRDAVRFTTGTGATITAQDITESNKTLTLSTQRWVAFQFSSKEATLDIDRIGERYLESAAVALANAVDVDALTFAYQATANSVGTPGTVPSTFKLYTQAGALLDKSSAPIDRERSVVFTPDMQVEILDALKGLFQSSEQIKRQYERGRMGTAAGFDWILDQNIITHTVGPLGGTPLVNGASQTGASLITDGWTASAAARLKKGDVFTIAGVFMANAVSGATQSNLQQFVVTADVSSDGSGNATIPIYPSIVTSGPTKTVSGSPADNAALTIVGAANTLTPQGLAFHKDAFVIGMAPLETPMGVHMTAKQQDAASGVSIRVVGDYNITSDMFVFRADVLYGFVANRPEWACRVQS